MYETLNAKDFEFLSDDDKDMLSRISAYSEKVIGDVDPQKMRISEQLEKLKPIMQEIADERGMALEDIFIKYMDLATLVNAKKDQKFKEDMQDLGVLESSHTLRHFPFYFTISKFNYFTTLTLSTPSIAESLSIIAFSAGFSRSIMVYANSPLDLFIISVILIPSSPKHAVNLVIIFAIFLWKIAIRLAWVQTPISQLGKFTELIILPFSK